MALQMTPTERRFRASIIGEAYVARLLHGKRLNHLNEFDVETDDFLFEVKSFTSKQESNPKIHIMPGSLGFKERASWAKNKPAFIVACRLVNNQVVETRFGPVRAHFRFKSLEPIDKLLEMI